MTVKTSRWELAQQLDSDEKIALFLEAVFEEGDPAIIASALGDVARLRGMTEVARDTGLSRENLYRALGPDGNPEFATVLKVIKAMGFDLTVSSHKAA